MTGRVVRDTSINWIRHASHVNLEYVGFDKYHIYTPLQKDLPVGLLWSQ